MGIPSRIIKEWSYADKKDLSMNLGGLMHDAATLLAGRLNIEDTNKEIADLVGDLALKLYTKKCAIQEEIIKNS